MPTKKLLLCLLQESCVTKFKEYVEAEGFVPQVFNCSETGFVCLFVCFP